MRPKANQKPWQRRAVQYGLYAIWPLLLLWLVSSYPGSDTTSAASGGVTRHTTAADILAGDVDSQGAGGRQAKMAVNGGAAGRLGAGGEEGAAQWRQDDMGGLADVEAGDGDDEEGGQGPGSGAELVGTIGGGQAGAAGGPGGEDPNRIYSSATIYAVRNGNGQLAKFYYKFKNVRLTRKFLYFHRPPGMDKPDDHWVDFISGNATEPRLPTVIVIKGEVQRQKWYYLPIKYTTAPLTCAHWTRKPTYFLQVRYSYNIWHTWNEGLMGAFQTLREQGLLPLAQVDAKGNMREVTEGLTDECPLIWDEVLNGTRPEDSCAQRLGVVKGSKCDSKKQPWCRPGVVSYRRFDGPIILPYTAASVMNRWAQVYDAMTTDVRDMSLVDGHCFSSLLVGKTNTLNYYQPMNLTAENTTAHIRERIEAMAVFKHFVGTAQREYVAAERRKNPAAVEFRGYSNPKMETLRQGIGPENISLVEYIAPSEVPGLLREELPQLKEMWAKRRKEIARIEAAWKKGHVVVDGEAGDDKAEGAAGDKAAAVPAAGKADAAAAGGKVEAEGQGEGGKTGGAAGAAPGGAGASSSAAAERRRLLLESSGGTDAASSSGGSSGSGSSLAQPQGEGSRRRMPHRALLQGEGGAADAGSGSEATEGEDGAAPAGGAQQQGAGAAEAGQQQQQAAAADGGVKMPPILQRTDEFSLEEPRPVVTYMSRNFFSRGVLNEHDVLRYILAKYNVTLRVTTFEEPLLEAIDLLQHTDVLIGMHGAGWTNGMFIKHGAVTLQMYPYGWRLPDNSTIRGYNYREIVLASECRYSEWVSQRWDYAFFRRIDFNRRVKMEYVLHPDPHGPHPVDGWPGNPWVYQNTYVDMEHFGPYIDQAMASAGIKPVANPIPVTLNR